MTGDESWMFEYDPETKWQSRQWKSPASPRPKKAKMSKSKVKVMLIAFFDIKGIEFLPQGQTVNQYVYIQGDPLAPHEISPGQEEGSVGEQRLGAPP